MGKVATYVALHIKVNHENKTWSLSSDKMDDPSWRRADYSDIEAIFRSRPSGYHVHEERFPNGKFKSFTVETV